MIYLTDLETHFDFANQALLSLWMSLDRLWNIPALKHRFRINWCWPCMDVLCLGWSSRQASSEGGGGRRWWDVSGLRQRQTACLWEQWVQQTRPELWNIRTTQTQRQGDCCKNEQQLEHQQRKHHQQQKKISKARMLVTYSIKYENRKQNYSIVSSIRNVFQVICQFFVEFKLWQLLTWRNCMEQEVTYWLCSEHLRK